MYFFELAAPLQPGDDIFVGQYLFTGSETSSLYLKVDEVDEKNIYCTCKNGRDAQQALIGRDGLTTRL